MKDTIKEDEGGGEGGSTSNSTTQIAKPDKPMMADKAMRRSKLEEWMEQMIQTQVKRALS